MYIPKETEVSLTYEAIISPGQNQFLLRPNPILCPVLMKDRHTSLRNNCARVFDIERGIQRDQGKTEHSQRCHNCSNEERGSSVQGFGMYLYRTDMFAGFADLCL